MRTEEGAVARQGEGCRSHTCILKKFLKILLQLPSWPKPFLILEDKDCVFCSVHGRHLMNVYLMTNFALSVLDPDSNKITFI